MEKYMGGVEQFSVLSAQFSDHSAQFTQFTVHSCQWAVRDWGDSIRENMAGRLRLIDELDSSMTVGLN